MKIYQNLFFFEKLNLNKYLMRNKAKLFVLILWNNQSQIKKVFKSEI